MYVGADEISSLISRKVFRFSDERGLQDGIETFLKSKSIPYEREFVLSPQNRIDFLLGDAEDPRIKTLILVTTRSPHKSIARTLLGKPVLVVHLLASIF
jgi:hypothetical protein